MSDRATGRDAPFTYAHRVIACRAEPNYRLWVRFDDGLQGSVFLGNLLDVGCFKFLRDVREFKKAKAATGGGVTWEAGVYLDPDNLYQEIAAGGGIYQEIAAGGGIYQEIAAGGGIRVEPPEQDAAWQRFLQAALSPPARRRTGRGRGTPRRAPGRLTGDGNAGH